MLITEESAHAASHEAVSKDNAAILRARYARYVMLLIRSAAIQAR